LASSLPVLIMLVNWSVYLTLFFVKRNQNTLYSGFQSSLMLLYSIHPYIVKAGVALISCKTIESDTLWLTADVSMECWKSDHVFYVLTLFLPMFLLYILGIPMAILISVTRLRKGEKQTLVTFFTAGYRHVVGIWEVVVSMRKTLLILVLGLLGSSESVIQIISAMVVLYLFLEWHIRAAPFVRDFHNKLEAYSIFLQLVLTGFSFYFIPSLHIRDVILIIISFAILILVLGFILTSLGILLAQIVVSRKKQMTVAPALVASTSTPIRVVSPPPPSNNSSILLLIQGDGSQDNIVRQ